jgi:cell wall-associated NlpC family hydrolase
MKKLLSLLIITALTLSFGSSVFASPAIVKSSVSFRSTPSTTTGYRYQYIKAGTELDVQKVNNWWSKVTYNGKTGYVSNNYLTVTKDVLQPTQPEMTVPINIQDLINEALSYQGKVHYVYGKNIPSTLTFDCSSFTKFIFAKYGYSLKWGANLQYNQFPHVVKSDLKPGDLVFFSVGSSTSIGHVGIYIGNNQFVHNTTGKVYSVTVSSITTGYYANHYKGAARVIS